MNNNFKWTEDAIERVNKVPEGFMRNMTKKRIEEEAAKNSITEITLETVERVIDVSRAGMGSAMGGDAAGMKFSDFNHKKKEADNENFYFCFVCGFTVEMDIPDICPICKSSKEKFSGIKKEFITKSSMKAIVWTENAAKILNNVPDDFRKDMTKWEIEGFCRKKGYLVASADVIDERYKVWEKVAQKIEKRLPWSDAVTERITKIPPFIRGMVIREMELYSEKKGEKVVSIETLNSIRENWVDTREFHVKWQG